MARVVTSIDYSPWEIGWGRFSGRLATIVVAVNANTAANTQSTLMAAYLRAVEGEYPYIADVLG